MHTRFRWPLLLLAAVFVFVTWWPSRHATPPADAGLNPPSTAAPNATAADAPASTDASRHPTSSDSHARDLSIDEARGGHTLARHVARSDDDLRERLTRERSISAASTWTDRRTAETAVARALAQQQDRVDRWTSRSGSRPNLALTYRGERTTVLGRSLERGATTTVPCYDAVIVLRWNGDDYFVLTSYPEARYPESR